MVNQLAWVLLNTPFHVAGFAWYLLHSYASWCSCNYPTHTLQIPAPSLARPTPLISSPAAAELDADLDVRECSSIEERQHGIYRQINLAWRKSYCNINALQRSGNRLSKLLGTLPARMLVKAELLWAVRMPHKRGGSGEAHTGTWQRGGKQAGGSTGWREPQMRRLNCMAIDYQPDHRPT